MDLYTKKLNACSKRSFDYAYDPIGNRITSKEYDHEDNARVSSYTANALNQYTQRTVPGYAGVRGSATNTATVTVNGNTAWRLGEYFYGGDEADNAASAVMKELDITAVVNPPGTNTPDLVESITGRVFVAQSPEALTYDDDGNMLSDGRFTYTWDGENRLVTAETRPDLLLSVPRVKVTYNYDHRSRRIGKQSYTWATDHWTLITGNSSTYDGWNLIQELTHTQTHTLTNFYTWGLDLSGSLQGAGGVGGLLAVVQDSATYVPAWDGNGNVMEYASTDGTLVAHYEYSPFGETVVQSGDMADTFAFRFSTKYWENEAKLYYYGYRFYSPSMGRWSNRDPIGERGGANVYLFCSNESVVRFDYLGQFSWFSKKTTCCNELPYDSNDYCCCKDCTDTPGATDADLIPRKKIDTGVTIYCRKTRWYHIPIYRPWAPDQLFVMHCWLAIDSEDFGRKRAGAYPIRDNTPNSVIEEQEKYTDTEDSFWTTENHVELSPCEYDIEKFRACVLNRFSDSENPKKTIQPFNWSLYNNCLDWVHEVIDSCKDASGGVCSRF